MTKEELAAHKEKIRAVMIAHLTPLGYPDMEFEAIMNELKNMYVKVEEAGLILPGMTFRAFQDMANLQLMMAQMHNMMGL